MKSRAYGNFAVQEFDIQGPLLITPKIHRDDRGFFIEKFRDGEFREIGLPHFVQENFSRSRSIVLRGLHFQHTPAQGKLISVTRGEVFDVALDIRSESPTFGKHISVRLSGENPQWIWVPKGFAHGFLVTSSEGADLVYKVDTYYDADGEAALRWDDKDLAIPWPLNGAKKEDLNLSKRDQSAASFAEYRMSPKFSGDI